MVKVYLEILLFSVPEPDIAEPECRVDSDCPSRLACLNEHCQNPCTTLSPCGVNAECTVQNTLPQRTMICMCLPGYVGDANTLCSLRKILFTFFSLGSEGKVNFSIFRWHTMFLLYVLYIRLKGLFKCIFKLPSMQRGQCSIHSGALKNFAFFTK